MVGKAQKSHGTRPGLYGGCSNGVLTISVSAFIATFQSRNADAQLRLLHHPKKSSFKPTITPFSRSGWSVVRRASLAMGDTSKKRPSPHLHKVPTWSSKLSPRTLQTAFVDLRCIYRSLLTSLLLVSLPLLLLQCSGLCPPHLDAVSWIRNIRMHRSVIRTITTKFGCL
jgi:hypothetical protein